MSELPLESRLERLEGIISQPFGEEGEAPQGLSQITGRAESYVPDEDKRRGKENMRRGKNGQKDRGITGDNSVVPKAQSICFIYLHGCLKSKLKTNTHQA